MIDALIDGERRGQVLADLAIGRMWDAGKLADLSMALAGRFTDHHALLCRLHRDRIVSLDDVSGHAEHIWVLGRGDRAGTGHYRPAPSAVPGDQAGADAREPR